MHDTVTDPFFYHLANTIGADFFIFLPMAKDELPPSPPFRSRPPKYTGGLGECCKPQWSVGQSPSRHDLVHIGVKKCSSGGSSFVDFPKNKCNFLHKNKLDIIWRVQILSAVPYEEFSAAAVATIALWKLAPMANSQTLQKTAI